MSKQRINDPKGDMGFRPVGLKPCQFREPCANAAVKGEKYCRPHRAAMLKEMEAAGYFVDTNEKTVYEYERQHNQASGERSSAVEDMMDRLDSYRDHANENAALAD